MSRRVLVTMVAALVLSLLGSTAVLAVTLSKNGKAVTAVRTVTADDSVNRQYGVWADVPGMSTTVSVPAEQRAILLIRFSAEANCWGYQGGLCKIQVLVNGTPASPGDAIFDTVTGSSTASERETYSMEFVAGPLSSGAHTVTVQWFIELMCCPPDPTIPKFFVESRTLTVLRSRV